MVIVNFIIIKIIWYRKCSTKVTLIHASYLDSSEEIDSFDRDFVGHGLGTTKLEVGDTRVSELTKSNPSVVSAELAVDLVGRSSELAEVWGAKI